MNHLELSVLAHKQDLPVIPYPQVLYVLAEISVGEPGVENLELDLYLDAAVKLERITRVAPDIGTLETVAQGASEYTIRFGNTLRAPAHAALLALVIPPAKTEWLTVAKLQVRCNDAITKPSQSAYTLLETHYTHDRTRARETHAKMTNLVGTVALFHVQKRAWQDLAQGNAARALQGLDWALQWLNKNGQGQMDLAQKIQSQIERIKAGEVIDGESKRQIEYATTRLLRGRRE